MAVDIPGQLKEVAEQLNNGHTKNVTVRELLSWFGAERRGYWKVREIRKALRRKARYSATQRVPYTVEPIPKA